jgi:HSP20 family protein
VGTFLKALMEKRHMANLNNTRDSQLVVVPATDIYEGEKDYLLALDVPGIEGNSVEVEIDNDVLKVSARRAAVGDEHRYARDFRVPSGVNTQAISASVKDGVLSVVLPKHEHVLPKRIPVNVH